MIRAGSIVLGFLVSACGSKGLDPATCRRQAADLAALLRSANHEPGMIRSSGKLVTRTDLSPRRLPHAPVVSIAADGVMVNGMSTSVESIGERFEAMQRQETDRQMMRRGHDTDLTLLYFLVDEDARWEDVSGGAAAAHAAGYTRPAFVFARPPTPVQAPPRSAIDDDLDAIMKSEPSNRASELADLTAKVTRSCPALTEAFGHVASTEESKADFLIDAIEPALTACNCSLDLASFSSIMYRLLYVPDDTAHLRVTLDPAGTRVALPPSTPWRQAHAKLPAGPVWLE